MSLPRRVAILGGGMGSLSTAFWLTSEPGWQERYDAFARTSRRITPIVEAAE